MEPKKRLEQHELETLRRSLAAILEDVEELKAIQGGICNPPPDGTIKSDATIQSGNIYIQAAGSDGDDDTVEGIQLRWALTSVLGENHLPKGDLAAQSGSYYEDYGYIKDDDFVKIYKTNYTNTVPIDLDLSSALPDLIIDADAERKWSYAVTNTYSSKVISNTVIINFPNVSLYDGISVNPATNPIDFLAQYNDYVEISVLNKLCFAAEINIDSVMGSPSICKYETLYVSELHTTEEPTITSRKFMDAGGGQNLSHRIVGENIVRIRIRFMAGAPSTIKLETYEDFLRTRDSWENVGSFALTIDDMEASNRLTGSAIDNIWPKYNDGITTRADNYLDKWSADGGVKEGVISYLNLSKSDMRANADLGNELVDADASKQQVSYLDLLNLAAIDYHVARMMGLGYIDTNPSPTDKVVYIAIYTTNIGLPALREKAVLNDHIYMTLPTDKTDYRLPPIPKQLNIGYGLNNLDPCASRDICDEDGYSKMERVRFVNLNKAKYDHEIAYGPFYDDDTEFDVTELTLPVLFGIEYKAQSASDFVKPEITSSIEEEDYKDYDEDNSEGTNETVPVPASNKNPIFIHVESESGVHQYGLYAINWFNRVSPVSSTLGETDDTQFASYQPVQNPIDLAAQYIQEESPLLFTTQAEQDDLSARKTATPSADNYWTRLTFNWCHLQKLAYQTADTLEFYYRQNAPLEVNGRISQVSENPNDHTCEITVESYDVVTGRTVESVSPQLSSGNANKFIGSMLSTENGSFKIADVSVTSNMPTFTVYQNLEKQVYVDSDQKGEIITRCKYINPTVGKRFTVLENLSDVANWTKLDRTLTLFDFDEENDVYETVVNPEGADTTYIVGGIAVNAEVELIEDEDEMPGLFKVTYTGNPLDDHPEMEDGHVFWYKGIMRIPEDGLSRKKALPVLKMEIDGSNLVVWAYDPEFSESSNYIPLQTGSSIGVNFHPGYRIYLEPEENVFDKEIIQDYGDEDKKITYLAVRAVDSTNDATSALSEPIPVLAIKQSIPLVQNKPVGPQFATRPDKFGKSTYTMDLEIETPPFSLLFSKSNDSDILDALYLPDTIADIHTSIMLLETNEHEADRYYDLVNLIFDTDSEHLEEFVEYDEYRMPTPDKIEFTNSETFEEKIAVWKLAVEREFIPISEQPVIHRFIKDDSTPTEGKAAVIRNANNELLDADDPAFDPYPYARRFTDDNTDYVRITDFNLNGASKNYYFYTVQEVSNKLQMSAPGLIAGPVFLINSMPAAAPYIRIAETVLANPYLAIGPGVRFEINPYIESEGITHVAIYRCLTVEEAQSVRSMKLAKTVMVQDSILDDFEGEEVIPFGDDIYYRLVALRKIKNERGEDEFIPSIPSEIKIVQVVDNINPEPPEITANIGSTTSSPDQLLDVELSWDNNTYKGKYYLYKMSDFGQWQLVDTFDYSDAPMSYEYSVIEKQDEDEDTIYHRFKVVAENRNGLLSLEEKILTL
jgi:hypothetical protein